MKSPSIDQKIIAGFRVIFCFVHWLRLLRISLKVVSRPSLTGWSRLRVASRTPQSLPDNFVVPSAIGKIKCSPLFGVLPSFALSFRAWIFLTRPNSQLLNVCNHDISFPNSPRAQHTSEEYSSSNFPTNLVEP